MGGHMSVAKFVAAGIVVLAWAATASAAGVDGTWKWTAMRQGRETEMTLTLKAEGEKLTGKLSRGNRENEITNGTIKGDEIAFEVTAEFNGNSFTTKYKGKVEGDTIKGTTERERDGQVRTRDWEAKRSQ